MYSWQNFRTLVLQRTLFIRREFGIFACSPLALQAEDIDAWRKTTGRVACSAKGLQAEVWDKGAEGDRCRGESSMM